MKKKEEREILSWELVILCKRGSNTCWCVDSYSTAYKPLAVASLRRRKVLAAA
jgi:hypothetical protein